MSTAYKWVAEDSPEIKDPAYRKFSFNNEVNICRFHHSQYLVPCAIHQNIVTLIDIFKQKITLPHRVQVIKTFTMLFLETDKAKYFFTIIF